MTCGDYNSKEAAEAKAKRFIDELSAFGVTIEAAELNPNPRNGFTWGYRLTSGDTSVDVMNLNQVVTFIEKCEVGGVGKALAWARG